MTFGKKDDGCWHWEYAGPYARGSGRNLWTVWLFVMVLLCVSLGITAVVKGASQLIVRVLLIIALALGLFVTLIFVLVWLWDRFGKKRRVYTADERVFSPTNAFYSGRYTRLYFDQVKSLTRCKERDAIILKATLLPVEVYADENDYEAVWNFLRDRCPNAEIIEESGAAIIPKPTNNQKKPDGRISTLWAVGVMLLVLAIAFSIGWATRGLRIHDFTGIGQAEILKVTTIERYSKERNIIEYRSDVRITAGEMTFVDRYDLSSRPDWQKGDVLPITYNINNPREYIIDNTPEEYAQWYNFIGKVALGLMLGAMFCFLRGFQIRRLTRL